MALAFAARAFGSHGTTPIGTPDPNAVVFSFTVTGTGSGTPTGTMTVDGKTVEGSGSTYSWNFDGGSMVADTFGAEFEFKGWTDVAADYPVEVGGTATQLEGWVDASNGDARQPRHMYQLDLDDAAVPSEPGRYVIEFTATWPQGARTFYFPIQVASSSSAQTSDTSATVIRILRSGGRTLDGNEITPQALSGRIVVLVAWGSWCRPCEGALIAANASAIEHAGESDLAFVGLNFKDDTDVAKREQEALHLVFPSIEHADAIAEQLDVRALPMILIVRADGTVIDRLTSGPTTKNTSAIEDLQRRIDSAIGEGVAPGSPAAGMGSG